MKDYEYLECTAKKKNYVFTHHVFVCQQMIHWISQSPQEQLDSTVLVFVRQLQMTGKNVLTLVSALYL